MTSCNILGRQAHGGGSTGVCPIECCQVCCTKKGYKIYYMASSYIIQRQLQQPSSLLLSRLNHFDVLVGRGHCPELFCKEESSDSHRGIKILCQKSIVMSLMWFPVRKEDGGAYQHTNAWPSMPP